MSLCRPTMACHQHSGSNWTETAYLLCMIVNQTIGDSFGKLAETFGTEDQNNTPAGHNAILLSKDDIIHGLGIPALRDAIVLQNSVALMRGDDRSSDKTFGGLGAPTKMK